MERSDPRAVDLAADCRGVVTVEYAVVLTLVAVLVCLAIAGLGPPLVARFRMVQALIGLPIP